MRRNQEIARMDSCLNRSGPNELVFVLCGRDACAPAAIRAWCNERIKAKKNYPHDAQITDALLTAKLMEQEYATLRQGCKND